MESGKCVPNEFNPRNAAHERVSGATVQGRDSEPATLTHSRKKVDSSPEPESIIQCSGKNLNDISHECTVKCISFGNNSLKSETCDRNLPQNLNMGKRRMWRKPANLVRDSSDAKRPTRVHLKRPSFSAVGSDSNSLDSYKDTRCSLVTSKLPNSGSCLDTFPEDRKPFSSDAKRPTRVHLKRPSFSAASSASNSLDSYKDTSFVSVFSKLPNSRSCSDTFPDDRNELKAVRGTSCGGEDFALKLIPKDVKTVHHGKLADNLLNMEMSNSSDNKHQGLKLLPKNPSMNVDKEKEASPKKRQRSRKRSECKSNKHLGHSSCRSTRSIDTLLDVEVSNSNDNELQGLKLLPKNPSVNVDKEKEVSPKKRKRSRKHSECKSKKHLRHSSCRSTHSIDTLLDVEVSNSNDNKLQGLKLLPKNPSMNVDKEKEASPKKRKRSRKHSECKSKKHLRHSSCRCTRSIGGGGSDRDDTSGNSATGCKQITSSENALSSQPMRPLKYNFCVELAPHLDSNQKIALLQQKIQELRKVYMNVKAELARIDRRRKELRRREREKKRQQSRK